MIQSFHTQLQVTLRALREVVAPAIDPKEKQAVEQLHLSLAMLSFMAARLPHLRQYHRAELSHYLALADKVAAMCASAASDFARAIEEGKQELERGAAEIEDYLGVTRRIREGIAALVAQTDDPALDALIVAASKDLILLERVWCQPFGFELDPASLPSLDRLL